MVSIKKHKHRIVFYLLLNLAIAAMITFSSYVRLPLYAPKDYVYYGIHFLILQFTVAGFAYILTLNKWLFRVVFPVLFFLYALFAFGVYSMGIAPTDAIIKATMETKPDIVADLISGPVVVYVLLILLVIAGLEWYYHKHRLYEKQPWFVFAWILAAWLLFNLTEAYRPNTLISRMPYNLTWGVYNYFQKPEVHIDNITEHIIPGMEGDLRIILVLGESLRADHLHLNGYSRPTTPHLDTMPNLISLKTVYTPLTYTGISLPQILTNQSINDRQIHPPLYSIYTVASRAGLKSVWIGNQTPEKSYAIFIDENTRKVLIDSMRDSYSFMKKKDEELLSVFRDFYRKKDYRLITLHMIGSHWWYENRYPPAFRRFKPVIKSKFIPSNTPGEMINSYDNTVLYFDYFLTKLIRDISPGDNTLVVFLSDHGENLGEDGLWLHARHGKAATHPAALIWFTPLFAEKHPAWVERMRSRAKDSLTTDFLYPTVLDLIRPQGFVYDTTASIIR